MSATHGVECRDDARRAAVRGATLNGLDYVEVSQDQRTLTVWFLGRAPTDVGVANVRVDGGRRVRDLRVVSVTVHREPRRGRDDWMDVEVDRAGDFSTYTLRLVDAAHPDRPLAGFDVRYATLDFSFKAGCPSDLDCADEPPCDAPRTPRPDVNYLARDYTGFRQVLLDRLSVLLPEWRERHVPDVGIALVELLAYTGDYLSQYQDAVATEAYLDTARLRVSVRRHARLVDYRLFDGCNARAWLTFDAHTDVELDLDRIAFATRFRGAPAGRGWLAPAELERADAGPAERFEALWPRGGKVQARAAHSRIDLYTWGDGECCLPAGATEATLVDAWLPPAAVGPEGAPLTYVAPVPHEAMHGRRLDALAVGDVLILEEVIGPATGEAADADPSHRHAVRLTEVRRDVDALYPVRDAEPRGTPLVHVRWHADDALPFPLCVSTHRPAPDCGPLTGVTVVRGNVILVDHGHTVEDPLPPVPGDEPPPVCDPCDDVGPAGAPPRYEPTLDRAPLVFAAPLDLSGSARRMATPAAPDTSPALSLVPLVRQADGSDATLDAETWTTRDGLLDLAPDERAFVAEVDDEGVAHLRFDGVVRPARGTRLRARYRVGGGLSGNVGPDAITLIVSDDTVTGVALAVRNPLPATGGLAPESLAEAKLLAPATFRQRRERAVIASDYAELLARDLGDEVQGAAAMLRWTGSWYEAQVGVDARGAEEASGALLRRARERLHRYRRIGHDLRVSTARLVPLSIALDVCVAAHMPRAAVRAALRRRLGTGERDGQRGFFHPDELRYGEGVSVSALVAAAARLPGVSSVAVTRLERLGEGPNRELENGILPLGAMEIAQLDDDPTFPDRGTLTLNLTGGR